MVPMADDVVVDEGKQELVMWLDEDNSERATKNMVQRKKTNVLLIRTLGTEYYQCQTYIRCIPVNQNHVDIFI